MIHVRWAALLRNLAIDWSDFVTGETGSLNSARIAHNLHNHGVSFGS